MRFTKPAVEALKRRTERYEVWEDGKSGLGLRISPSGRKTWVLMYRHEGKPRRLTIGRYPKIGIAAAHTAAGKAREALEHGRDPGAENVAQRRAERQAETINQLADEYLTRHAVKKKTGNDDRWNLDREIRPAWGTKKAASVTRRDVIVLLDRIEDRGAPVMRNRIASLVSKLFRFGIERGILESSPCIGISRLPEASRERVLSAPEIKTLWNGLATAKMAPVCREAIRLALVTLQRRGEVAGASRDEIDGETWEIPASRTKNGKPQSVPLSPLALSVLAAIDDLRRREAERLGKPLSPWLFPSPLTGERHISEDAISRALQVNRVHLGLSDPPATIHDLRRSGSTTMGALGVTPFIVGKVLGHTDPTITGKVYNRHDYLPEKRHALAVWAQFIEDTAAGRKIAANVTTLRPEAVKTA